MIYFHIIFIVLHYLLLSLDVKEHTNGHDFPKVTMKELRIKDRHKNLYCRSINNNIDAKLREAIEEKCDSSMTICYQHGIRARLSRRFMVTTDPNTTKLCIEKGEGDLGEIIWAGDKLIQNDKIWHDFHNSTGAFIEDYGIAKALDLATNLAKDRTLRYTCGQIHIEHTTPWTSSSKPTLTTTTFTTSSSEKSTSLPTIPSTSDEIASTTTPRHITTTDKPPKNCTKIPCSIYWWRWYNGSRVSIVGKRTGKQLKIYLVHGVRQFDDFQANESWYKKRPKFGQVPFRFMIKTVEISPKFCKRLLPLPTTTEAITSSTTLLQNATTTSESMARNGTNTSESSTRMSSTKPPSTRRTTIPKNAKKNCSKIILQAYQNFNHTWLNFTKPIYIEEFGEDELFELTISILDNNFVVELNGTKLLNGTKFPFKMLLCENNYLRIEGDVELWKQPEFEAEPPPESNFGMDLDKPLSVGGTIGVKGRVPKDARNFTIALNMDTPRPGHHITNKYGNTGLEAIFHFYPVNKLELRSYTYAKGNSIVIPSERKNTTNLLERGQIFLLWIKVTNDRYQLINVNVNDTSHTQIMGQYFTFRKDRRNNDRLPANVINHIWFGGDMEIIDFGIRKLSNVIKLSEPLTENKIIKFEGKITPNFDKQKIRFRLAMNGIMDNVPDLIRGTGQVMALEIVLSQQKSKTMVAISRVYDVELWPYKEWTGDRPAIYRVRMNKRFKAEDTLSFTIMVFNDAFYISLPRCIPHLLPYWAVQFVEVSGSFEDSKIEISDFPNPENYTCEAYKKTVKKTTTTIKKPKPTKKKTRPTRRHGPIKKRTTPKKRRTTVRRRG